MSVVVGLYSEDTKNHKEILNLTVVGGVVGSGVGGLSLKVYCMYCR